MPDIKTKEHVKDIKVLDAKAIAKEHMLQAVIRTKGTVENLSDDGRVSPSEYAEENVSYVMQSVAGDTRAIAMRGARALADKRRNIVNTDAASEEHSYYSGTGTAEKKRSNATNNRGDRFHGQSAIKTRADVTKSKIAPEAQHLKWAVEDGIKIRTANSASFAGRDTFARVIRARKPKRMMGATLKKTAKASKQTLKAMVKHSIAAINKLVTAIAAGGSTAVIAVVLICLIGLIVGSSFGIFFSSEDSGTGMTMRQVVQEISKSYLDKIDEIKADNPHDKLEMKGSRAVWPEVLSIYAVKLTTDSDNPQEVATVTPEKKTLLEDIFWEMNEISYHSESRSETEIIESDDGKGNIKEETVVTTKTTLYITVNHKTADEMAEQYHFNGNQKQQLSELLAQDSKLWTAVLYGVYSSDDMIVQVALSQLGNVGGEPYWSWYGFESHVEWCACFVSWCADQCGYIDTGICPKFAGCTNGVQWFKERGQWLDNTAEPAPGMVIFFDWDNKGDSGPKDGAPDHTGIVEKVENGLVYTVEGNSGDVCRERVYPLGYYEILGYGVLSP